MCVCLFEMCVFLYIHAHMCKIFAFFRGETKREGGRDGEDLGDAQIERERDRNTERQRYTFL